MDSDWFNLLLLPIGLGLLGFIEPCTVGSSLLFIRYLEGNSKTTRLTQAILFTLTRALFIGGLGAIAALAGATFLDFQRGGWILLGALYAVLGAVYLSGQAGKLMRTLGPGFGRLSGARGTIALGIFFGLNIPACAGPLLIALTGAAAVSGDPQIGRGFITLALFGLALSLPLLLPLFSEKAEAMLSRLATRSAKVPKLIGLLFLVLGLWSIYLGLFVSIKS